MEFKDVVYGRRSVRKYSDRKIEEETLKEIIDAGLWAPSGINLQPWFFLVIQSEEKMAKLKEIMAEVASKSESHFKRRFANNPEVVESTVKYIANLGNAPCAILAFRDKQDYSGLINDGGLVQSISAAMENILLAAYDKGLGSCWLAVASQVDMEETIREAFAPTHGKLVCMATIGYPELIPNPPKRKEGKYEIV